MLDQARTTNLVGRFWPDFSQLIPSTTSFSIFHSFYKISCQRFNGKKVVGWLSKLLLLPLGSAAVGGRPRKTWVIKTEEKLWSCVPFKSRLN